MKTQRLEANNAIRVYHPRENLWTRKNGKMKTDVNRQMLTLLISLSGDEKKSYSLSIINPFTSYKAIN